MKNTNGTKNKKKKRIILFSVLGVLAAIAASVTFYVVRNMNYNETAESRALKAGFSETPVTLSDGTRINYAEGPDSGPPLLMIHGQTGAWQDYAKVLPELSKHFHVFAVDCPGHGKSAKDPEIYSAAAIGAELTEFIDTVIGEPAVITGHSSGGLIAVWMAANSPDSVLGAVFEDPPLFSTEEGRSEKTYTYIDVFLTCHSFLNQSEKKDFPMYYLENCYWLRFFNDGREGILNSALSYREKHPGERIKIFYLPPSVTGTFAFMENYDPRFGEAFYTGSWNDGFPHEETLNKIFVPTVLIHANWKYDDDGNLLGAMNDDDAERARDSISGTEFVRVDSGHGVHFEASETFIDLMVDFLDEISE